MSRLPKKFVYLKELIPINFGLVYFTKVGLN